MITAVAEDENEGVKGEYISQNIQILTAALDSYIEHMNPRKPENVPMFNSQQVSLWTAIYQVLEREDDFHEAMGVLLNYFRKHGGTNEVFHSYNVFRAMDTVPLDSDRIRAFQNIVTLLQIAASSVQFNKMNIDLNKAVTEGVFSEEARNRIFSYFQR